MSQGVRCQCQPAKWPAWESPKSTLCYSTRESDSMVFEIDLMSFVQPCSSSLMRHQATRTYVRSSLTSGLKLDISLSNSTNCVAFPIQKRPDRAWNSTCVRHSQIQRHSRHCLKHVSQRCVNERNHMRITLRKQKHQPGAERRGNVQWWDAQRGGAWKPPRNFPLEWIVFTSPSGQISLKSHPPSLRRGTPFLDECIEHSSPPSPPSGGEPPNLPTRGLVSNSEGVIFKGGRATGRVPWLRSILSPGRDF